MNQPKATVVITTYNYGQYLPQSIESVLSQSYSNIELIVVNDGSIDNTDEVIKLYLSQIKYITQQNSGVVTARNNGAKEASGDYLVFLDADDYLPPSFIEESIRVLKQNKNVDFVYGDREVFGLRKYRLKGRNWDQFLLRIINYIGLTTMMKREVFEKVGGFSRELNLKQSYEDWDFWLKLATRGFEGAYAPSVYYYYRRFDRENRNRAGIFRKMKLRWPVMKLRWWLYLEPSFLMRLPYLVFLSLVNKFKILNID